MLTCIVSIGRFPRFYVCARSAWGITFADDLGNISTSRIRLCDWEDAPSLDAATGTHDIDTATTQPQRQQCSRLHRRQILELQPRFPIFGGWRADFEVGFANPLADSLMLQPDGSFMLTISSSLILAHVSCYAPSSMMCTISVLPFPFCRP